MNDAAQLGVLRSRAFDIAYRMLGSVADAEDIAQEALLRVPRAQEHGRQIASRVAFVATVATRLAIDELRSARVRRETYVGTWLPEGAASLREVQVNGSPGAILLDRQGRVLGVLTLGFAGGRIATVTSVVNPEKLRHVGDVGDMGALVRGVRNRPR